jgi:N-methylhydantoinase A
VNRPVQAIEGDAVGTILRAQIEEGRALLAREAVAVEDIVALHRAEMQFEGQSHLLGVELPMLDIDRDYLQKAFEAAYWHRFEVALPEIRAVLVNLHTAVIGRRRRVALDALLDTASATTLEEAALAHRRVWFADGWRETPIYRRESLPRGAAFVGPAIVEQLDATTVIEPSDHVIVDKLGNLVITIAVRDVL